MPCRTWARLSQVLAVVGLVLGTLVWQPRAVQGAAFVWALETGAQFFSLKNGLRLDRKPPAFQRDIIGAKLTLSALGLLHINSWVEINGMLDAGQLVMGQRSRAGDVQGVVLLNEMQLNWPAVDQQSIVEAEQQCRVRAAQQGVPVTDCIFYSPALAESLLIRELYARIYLQKSQWVHLDVGFRDRTLGRGYIFDDYGLGLFFEANFHKRAGKAKIPLRFRFDMFLSDTSFTPEGKQSPVFHASLSYVRKNTSEVSFFASYMYDGDRLAAKAILPFWQDLLSARINGEAKQQANNDTQYFCRNNLTDDDYNALQALRTPDNSGNLQDTYNAVCDVLPRSSGHHLWFGIEGQGQFGKLTIAGAVIGYISSYKMSLPDVLLTDLKVRFSAPREVDIQGVGMMAEIKGTFQWSAQWSTSLYFLGSSGDHFEPEDRNYYTFVGITPQTRYTELFFNGGINAYSYQQGLGISSVSGKGVLVLGTGIKYNVSQGIELKLNVSALWSVVPSTFSTLEVTNSGQFYGGEFNFLGGYVISKWMRLVVQADLLLPGDFFAAMGPPPVVFRMQAGFTFTLGS